MRITKSPLELIDFFLLDTQCRYIAPSDDTDEDDTAIFEQYEIDIDFMFRPEERAKDELWVYVRIAVNCSPEPLPGYRIFIEGTGHYRTVVRDDVSDEEWKSLFEGSTLSIVINNLRAAIMQLTAHGPFGKYILPSVDLADLHRQKQASHAAATPKKRRTKKKAVTTDDE